MSVSVLILLLLTITLAYVGDFIGDQFLHLLTIDTSCVICHYTSHFTDGTIYLIFKKLQMRLLIKSCFICFIRVAACPSLTQVQNGAVVITTDGWLTSAAFSCNTGYQLTGSGTLTCTAAGSWDISPPACGRN
jgi:hypothetical protein